MYQSQSDVLLQYETLSKAVNNLLNIKPEDLEANNIYMELKEVRNLLEEREKNFPKPRKKQDYSEQAFLFNNAPVSVIGVL